MFRSVSIKGCLEGRVVNWPWSHTSYNNKRPNRCYSRHKPPYLSGLWTRTTTSWIRRLGLMKTPGCLIMEEYWEHRLILCICYDVELELTTGRKHCITYETSKLPNTFCVKLFGTRPCSSAQTDARHTAHQQKNDIPNVAAWLYGLNTLSLLQGFH